MNGTQLYDGESNKIYPITDARYIGSGVVVTTNTVYEDLSALLTKYQTLERQVTRADEIEGQLGVIVTYDTNNISSATAVQGQPFTNEEMVMPTSEAPYAWVKTVYRWAEQTVKITYNIVATALFPETQIMFAFGAAGSSVGGPSDYIDHCPDLNIEEQPENDKIYWYTYPNGNISTITPYAYIATRSRGANETWNGKVFHPAIYGQYPLVNDN